jgi:hypothetical protein
LLYFSVAVTQSSGPDHRYCVFIGLKQTGDDLLLVRPDRPGRRFQTDIGPGQYGAEGVPPSFLSSFAGYLY